MCMGDCMDKRMLHRAKSRDRMREHQHQMPEERQRGLMVNELPLCMGLLHHLHNIVLRRSLA
jgi:hypothetical protein